MAATDLAARALSADDLPDLEALVAEAGWNQTARDWQRMLTLGAARGVADTAGRVVASAVTIPYDGVGWIGMVLVTAAWRRQGIATDLLARAVDGLRGAGLTPGLDATPAGQAVYRRLGFTGDLALTRWRRPAVAGTSPPDLALAGPADLGWIVALDARAFGAARPGLIRLFLEQPAPGWTDSEAGFVLQRPGRTARQIGPLCAADAATAARLLRAAIGAHDGKLLIDLPDERRDLARLLEEAGFVPEREFLRLYLGGAPAVEPTALGAIAGPELG